MRALAIAATGMNAQQTNVEVIANNIANINTTAFKRARAEFTDLLYQTERAAGVPNRGGEDAVPEGAQIGLGVRTAAVRNLHMQGSLTSTGNKLDLAINGRGWFQIAGRERRDVLHPRRLVQQERHRPARHRRRLRRAAGDHHSRRTPPRSSSTRPARSMRAPAPTAALQLLGQLTLVNFANDAGLEPLGDNLYRETTASGAPVTGVPGDPGFGTSSRAISRTPTSIRSRRSPS